MHSFHGIPHAVQLLVQLGQFFSPFTGVVSFCKVFGIPLPAELLAQRLVDGLLHFRGILGMNINRGNGSLYITKLSQPESPQRIRQLVDVQDFYIPVSGLDHTKFGKRDAALGLNPGKQLQILFFRLQLSPSPFS